MTDAPESIPPAVSTATRKASGPIAAVSMVSIAIALGLGALNLLDPAYAEKLPDTLGTVPGWITSGGIMGILGMLIYWRLGERKIGVDQSAQHNIDKADIRDHYAAEVASLRERVDGQADRHRVEVAEIEGRYKRLLTAAEAQYRKAVAEVEDHYKAALVDAEKRHEECLRDRGELADEVHKLKDEVAGLRRQFALAGTDRVLKLGEVPADPPSQPVIDSAKRVRPLHAQRRRGADKAPKP